MENIKTILALKPKYIDLLGEEQSTHLLKLFIEIESGKYEKDELHQLKLNGIKHPLYIRAIRADMQSFVNTFIDAYLKQVI